MHYSLNHDWKWDIIFDLNNTLCIFSRHQYSFLIVPKNIDMHLYFDRKCFTYASFFSTSQKTSGHGEWWIWFLNQQKFETPTTRKRWSSNNCTTTSSILFVILFLFFCNVININSNPNVTYHIFIIESIDVIIFKYLLIKKIYNHMS